MFPDPDKLNELTPAEILDAAAQGHLGLDHRFLHALLDRAEEAKSATLAFAQADRNNDVVDVTPDLIALFRHWRTPDALPFLLEILKQDPHNVPDEAVETFVSFGERALEPLLKLYTELEEDDSGEVAFLLASLGVRDPRILELLKERLAFDLSDTALLLETYGDPAAIPVLEQALSELGPQEKELKRELETAISSLRNSSRVKPSADEPDSFDIWQLYPEREDVPVDALDEDARFELIGHSQANLRAIAVHSFFNQELSTDQRKRILDLAQSDPDANVRGNAWQTLINSTEEESVLNAMLAALRKTDTPPEERAGLMIGLAPEVDRNEVRNAIAELYRQPAARAKALEAMWRSMHPAFRDYFAKHLNEDDLEVRRSAIWGIGYYGVRSELDKLRKLFEDDELRMDALFAYALAVPGETSRARAKSFLSRIESEAKGLSEMEEELVKAALDERLLLAGKEPVFRGEED